MDDISLLFDSNEWKKHDPNEEVNMEKFLRNLKHPGCEEVDRIEIRRRNEQASVVLQESKKKYQEKIHRLKEKTKRIKKEEKELVDNLAKFNTFVKEKKLKVERALKTEMEEKTMRKNMTVEIDDKEQMVSELTIAKDFMEDAVQNRKMFQEFLQTVVESDEARSRYKDIRELIRRCETLVASRDNLMATRDRIRKEIQLEEENMAHFKEVQNARILDLSAKLNEMQEKYYVYEAKTREKQRIIDAEEKEGMNKQLNIANIKISILTLWQYVFARKVILPGDRKLEEEYSKDRPPSLMDQLADVQAHIEDLHVVIDRTTEAVDLDLYNAPLCSDFSELRIDY